MRKRGKKRILNGKEFYTLTEISIAFDICAGTLSKKLGQGLSLEDAVQACIDCKKKKFVYRGVPYSSLDALAEEVGMNDCTLKDRIFNQKMSVEDAVEIPLKHKPTNISRI